MADPMCKTRDALLAEVEALCAQATPGPWEAGRLLDPLTQYPLTKSTAPEYVHRCLNTSDSDDFHGVVVDAQGERRDVCHTGNGPNSWLNAAFIAASRELLPKLAAALREAREQWYDDQGRLGEYDRAVNRPEAQLAERDQRIDALLNAGHDPTCNGIDEVEHRCACGWLQREGGHQYILGLERTLATAREEIERLKVDRNFEQVVVDQVEQERQRCLRIVQVYAINGDLPNEAYDRIQSGEEPRHA